MAVAAPITIAQRSAVPDAAQTADKKPAASEALPAFDVATIKPAAPYPGTSINYPAGGRFSASNITLLALMQWAYGMHEKQILDAPPWLSSIRFDIEAKSDADTDSQLRKIAPDQEGELKRRMIQALLAERCRLKLHPETRILPAYDLILAKGGSRLQPSQSDDNGFGAGDTYFNGQGMTTTLIARKLSEIAGRIVVDKTNLPDHYDFKLQWTSDSAPITDNSAPSLFTAIQEQLGLKLEPAKEPIPVLVIDHVEQPSSN